VQIDLLPGDYLLSPALGLPRRYAFEPVVDPITVGEHGVEGLQERIEILAALVE
jgi:hypothetical protein